MCTLHQNFLDVRSAAGTANDASERVAVEYSLLGDATQCSGEIRNQLSHGRINDMTGRDHGSAASTA